MRRYLIYVYGEVQGVFYRKTAQNHAQTQGLYGFARNQPDGSVYIEAEGPEDVLQQFLDWCRYGPPAARVDRLEVVEEEPYGYDSFTVY